MSGYNTGGMGGYFHGAFPDEVEAMVKNLLVGEDPLSREHLWNLMRDNARFHESLIGTLDAALWDLAGRYAGMSVSQLMGKAREKVRAYASTHPNMGTPEDYAKFAAECKAQGYTAFKVHAYIYWNPITNSPAPRQARLPQARHRSVRGGTRRGRRRYDLDARSMGHLHARRIDLRRS